MKYFGLINLCLVLSLGGCVANPDKFTLADLEKVEPVLSEVNVRDSLVKAMQGYQAFLANTDVNAKTPEALRRLADLKIEQQFGVIVLPGQIERPDFSNTAKIPSDEAVAYIGEITSETADVLDARDAETVAVELSASSAALIPSSELVPANAIVPVIASVPREAIATYEKILREYPYYERNDQVLYQMARAYDELGENDQAMQVTERLVREYPHTPVIDEVYFRRGEFYFIRRDFLDAEEAYGVIIAMGKTSDFYELARYKMGWSLYKQELYEESLVHYFALLDYKAETGYGFVEAGATTPDHLADSDLKTATVNKEEERRVTDTFRVISLAFSYLGNENILNSYFQTMGRRPYESSIYENLAEFHVEKMRFNDAAQVYESFIEMNPLHVVSPRFSMRTTEVYAEGGFLQLVVESKKIFAKHYGLAATYWQHHDRNAMPEVISFLKTNLQDLAQHYHALYQEELLVDDKPANYDEARLWYETFLSSFNTDSKAPEINFRLADLHLEHEAYPIAALAYEKTAYEYGAHAQDATAGYAAVFAYRTYQDLVDEEFRTSVLRQAVDSSIRFASSFPGHEEAAKALGRAADDLYVMQAYAEAITAARQLVNAHAEAEENMVRRAWTVISHAHFDLQNYAQAEAGYLEVLGLLAEDAVEREEISENLAAAIYRQGELARDSGEQVAAAQHFLRIKSLTPTASIRPVAEYDAAAAMVQVAAWDQAADILNEFRATHDGHELQDEVTKQLAHVYRQAGEFGRAADEYLIVATNSKNEEQRSASLLLAGDFFERANRIDDALGAYDNYVRGFSEPLELNIETRNTMAKLYKTRDKGSYLNMLKKIVALDREAGDQRTDRTRHLAAHAALVIAEPKYDHFAEMELVLPFAENLREKQVRMDKSLGAMEDLISYQVAEVTTAATYYLAEIYRNFSTSLLHSERPFGLNTAELAAYDMALEEESFPFEERAIEVHTANLELLNHGTYTDWIEKSLTELRVLSPARFNKRMRSAGYLNAIDIYAYQSPLGTAIVATHPDLNQPKQVSVDSAFLNPKQGVQGVPFDNP